MKASELRIGNWVNYVSEGIGDTIQITYIQVDDDLGDNFQPIPLTEEWLLKFGFEYNSIQIGRYRLGVVFNPTAVCLFRDSDSPLERDFGNIQHVHQLQNLYFALTGDELTIKE